MSHDSLLKGQKNRENLIIFQPPDTLWGGSDTCLSGKIRIEFFQKGQGASLSVCARSPVLDCFNEEQLNSTLPPPLHP